MAKIGKREIDPRLQALFDQKKKVYSISKINTINNCPYEAWLTYIQHIKGSNGVYGILGSKIHDKLEEIIVGTATESDLPEALNQELLDLDMLGIDFPRDRKGGTSIRDGWISDMKQFCSCFVKPNGKFTTEELVIYKLNDDRYLQGYLDLIRHNKDGTISIYDWKTSSNFSAEDLIHHGRQLIFYCLAKEQEGEKVKEVAWIMLKYCEVKFVGKARSNSKEKTPLIKVMNRGKLIQELTPYLEADLTALGLDDLDVEVMMREAKTTNSFAPFPQEIQDNYSIKPYVRRYLLTDELRQETLDYIDKTADLFENKSESELDWKPRKFTKPSKKGIEKEDSFYCNILCNHRSTCPHIKKFNDMKILNKTDEEDLF